ncbi:ExbD/TolR family protein [Niabella ginsengisoli]|uniref:Biopolymer transporter ExbD n=1 Tax=Niabella ginsengisoli TaxID=522298 RepID=A0ABS9SDS6_9BACT|nr:biopolymer transporter ExbD [Niabella ginsengisoli]MCH5596517.1 biopolymer transporter ExbD [Niabella ginsengisoli]
MLLSFFDLDYGKSCAAFLNNKYTAMASIDINPTATRPQRGFSTRRKTAALRIDMTPMVDLGFLLITFFIFTATMNEPKAMDLFMPKDDGSPTPTSESGALSIIADKGGSIFYYEGKPSADGGNFKKSSLADIRKKIIDKKRKLLPNIGQMRLAKQRPLLTKPI